MVRAWSLEWGTVAGCCCPAPHSLRRLHAHLQAQWPQLSSQVPASLFSSQRLFPIPCDLEVLGAEVGGATLDL